jgi:hypothetical protein
MSVKLPKLIRDEHIYMLRNYPNCLQMRDRLELTECHNSTKAWNSTSPPSLSATTQILCPHTIPSVSSPEDSLKLCFFFFHRTSCRLTPLLKSYPLPFFTPLMSCLLAFALVSYYSLPFLLACHTFSDYPSLVASIYFYWSIFCVYSRPCRRCRHMFCTFFQSLW